MNLVDTGSLGGYPTGHRRSLAGMGNEWMGW